MRLSLIAAASVGALVLAAGTASAQHGHITHHQSHHIAPVYAPPVYGGYYNPGVYASPTVVIGGGYSSGFYNGGYSVPSYGGHSYGYSVPSYGHGYSYGGGYGYGGGSGHHHHR